MDQFGLVLVTPAEPPNGEYEANDRGLSGKQLYAHYPNGYGASVIRGPYSYGGPEGKYELGVFHGGDAVGDGSLCYASPITKDVVGWLTEEDVVTHLHEIARLPRNDECDHMRRDDWDPFDPDEGEADVITAIESLLGMLER